MRLFGFINSMVSQNVCKLLKDIFDLRNILFSVDSLEPVPREISDPTVNQLQANSASVTFWVLIVALATAVGVIFGVIMSRRCSKNDPFPSEHHRNQLSW